MGVGNREDKEMGKRRKRNRKEREKIKKR